MSLVSESQNQTVHERMLSCRRDENFVFRHPKQSRFFFGRLSQLEEVQAISEQQTIGRLVLLEKRLHRIIKSSHRIILMDLNQIRTPVCHIITIVQVWNRIQYADFVNANYRSTASAKSCRARTSWPTPIGCSPTGARPRRSWSASWPNSMAAQECRSSPTCASPSPNISPSTRRAMG